MKNSQKRFLGAMLATSSVLGVVAPSMTAMASVKDEVAANVQELREVINENLPKLKKDPKFSTFHKILYAADRLRIYNNLNDEADRVMGEIAQYSDKVHTPEIISIIDKMNNFSETKKMQMYDDLLDKYIPTLAKIDADAAQYLTERLDSWGTAVVFEADPNYSKATDAILKVTQLRKDRNKRQALKQIDVAKEAIKNMKTYKQNGEYLDAKLKVEVDLVNKISSGGGGGSSVRPEVREARDAVQAYENMNVEKMTLDSYKDYVAKMNEAKEAVDKVSNSDEKENLTKKIKKHSDDIEAKRTEIINANLNTTTPKAIEAIIENIKIPAYNKLEDNLGENISGVKAAIVAKVIELKKDKDLANQDELKTIINEAMKEVTVDYAKTGSKEDAEKVIGLAKSLDTELAKTIDSYKEQDVLAEELSLTSPLEIKDSFLAIGKATKTETKNYDYKDFKQVSATIVQVVELLTNSEKEVEAYLNMSIGHLKLENVKDYKAQATTASSLVAKIRTEDKRNKLNTKINDYTEEINEKIEELKVEQEEINKVKVVVDDYINADLEKLTLDNLNEYVEKENSALLSLEGIKNKEEKVKLLNDINKKNADINKKIEQLQSSKPESERVGLATQQVVNYENKKIEDLKLENVGSYRVQEKVAKIFVDNLSDKDIKSGLENRIKDHTEKVNTKIEALKNEQVAEEATKVAKATEEVKKYEELDLTKLTLKNVNEYTEQGTTASALVAELKPSEIKTDLENRIKDCTEKVNDKIKEKEEQTAAEEAVKAYEAIDVDGLKLTDKADYEGKEKAATDAIEKIDKAKKEALNTIVNNKKTAINNKITELTVVKGVNEIDKEKTTPEELATLLSTTGDVFKKLAVDDKTNGEQAQSEVVDLIIKDTKKEELKNYKDVEDYISKKIDARIKLIKDVNDAASKSGEESKIEMLKALNELQYKTFEDVTNTTTKDAIVAEFITKITNNEGKKTVYNTIKEITDALDKIIQEHLKATVKDGAINTENVSENISENGIASITKIEK